MLAYPEKMKTFKLSCLKCLFSGIITLYYSLSFPPKMFTSIGSCYKALKSGRNFKGSLCQSVMKEAWGHGAEGAVSPPGCRQSKDHYL